ncbi:MAG: hypothetical protein K6G33_11260 [Ruminococcus sp.]|uniref:zinc ribbon domain-containing protein n=1 Tax=Ruminococcus sp. TaxID=41978 RepID=UPI0025E59BB2|nr:zinc ribbon domain-containing protein [Ruminococcus sp.]MCR5601302.1 hypothetical protein [Ruminococcus sp.]
MYCSNCNSNLMDGTKKCPFCGTDLSSSQNSPQQQNPYNAPRQSSPYNNNYGGYNNYAPPPQPMFRPSAKTNDLAIVASIIMFIAIFLPFFTITVGLSVSASLFDGKDWLLFATIAVLGCVFAFSKMNKGVLTVGIISVILTIGEALLSSEWRLKSKLGEYWDQISSYVDINYSYGFYIMLIASIMLLAAGIFGVRQGSSSSF